jgi:hypothetical protein
MKISKYRRLCWRTEPKHYPSDEVTVVVVSMVARLMKWLKWIDFTRGVRTRKYIHFHEEIPGNIRTYQKFQEIH